MRWRRGCHVAELLADVARVLANLARLLADVAGLLANVAVLLADVACVESHEPLCACARVRACIEACSSYRVVASTRVLSVVSTGRVTQTLLMCFFSPCPLTRFRTPVSPCRAAYSPSSPAGPSPSSPGAALTALSSRVPLPPCSSLKIVDEIVATSACMPGPRWRPANAAAAPRSLLAD